MKNILAFLLLVSLSLFAEPHWIDSIDEAKLIAQKENKHIMVMLSKDACDACWYMENIVFDDEKVKVLLDSNFIPVYLDIYQDEIPSELKYVGTPTFYFLDASGNKLGFRVNGVKNVKDFTTIVNKILQNN
ncbi:MAG: thioredoxin [Arcobacter sp.]|nr:MAG: thioredoxin [Arcobacter sp.]